MGMTMVEKILASHSDRELIHPGDIIDVVIDARVARDFGGANVVKNMVDHNLALDDLSKTFFTFDCNPTGSDQKYAENQQICRVYARENGIKVYDINRGIGTHLLIEEGLAYPGTTAVSTDSHANILGAVGAFGQGMGDRDIAAAWNKGKVWFKVPESVKIILNGKFPAGLEAKDIVLNLLAHFGASRLLGYALELYGQEVDLLSLDDRITISSMATEMGAVILLIPPNNEVIRYCESRICQHIEPVLADEDSRYASVFELDASSFRHMISRPGKPHDAVPVEEVKETPIDSAFIGSCTNGRLQDMQAVAEILKNKKVAPGVVLKIVPGTDQVWNACLENGLIEIFKDAHALVSNPGCAGCAAGQVGQNGPGEVTISSGNRNFKGKQGKGEVYLASPSVVAASAVAGYITTPDDIPDKPAVKKYIRVEKKQVKARPAEKQGKPEKPLEISGRVWYINRDNIDTDMIFHNKYLAIRDKIEMGKYALDNLEGYEDFAKKSRSGDLIVAGKNFGSGSSRQQAVDCFLSLGIQCIIAGSFGSIYERNAINAAFPILVSDKISELDLQDGDELQVDFVTGKIKNRKNNKTISAGPFSDVQMEIYQNGGLF
jgi:3-isopropylmalate/(R)-2-methylmalate dehydratase large subunit